MSFLLRNNRKNKKTLGAKPVSSRLLTRTTSGIRSAGGGQMQVQRPAIATTQQKQSTAAVTPQQQTRVQGVISMEAGEFRVNAA